MIKGVNLGNWLVLEKWMSPELFDGTTAEDETHFCKELSEVAKQERLKVHRDSYITARDFAYIASQGITHVRIPIPFFIFGDFEPYVGCIEYLDKAFSWAEKYELKILLDLHTVPDSQNGFDNGGLCGVCKWHKNPDYVAFTLDLLEKLTLRYKDRKSLWGIEVLNEPISQEVWDLIDLPNRYPSADKDYAQGSEPVPTEFLKYFYTEAYKCVRKHSDDVVIVFHDGFRIKEWIGFFKKPEFKNFMLDIHLYLMVYTWTTGDETLGGYVKHIENDFAKTVSEMSEHFPLIVGEWCIEPMSKKVASFSKEEKKIYYQTIAKAQLKAWQKTQGWFFWSYKLHVDEAGLEGWDMGKMMALGYLNPVLIQ
jgi:glucan 1,3-beta-glucosidase